MTLLFYIEKIKFGSNGPENAQLGLDGEAQSKVNSICGCGVSCLVPESSKAMEIRH